MFEILYYDLGVFQTSPSYIKSYRDTTDTRINIHADAIDNITFRAVITMQRIGIIGLLINARYLSRIPEIGKGSSNFTIYEGLYNLAENDTFILASIYCWSSPV